MQDDLYDTDVLIWSEQQAALLRRLARGERVNEVDWAHVIEEIEDVGLAQLHAVESHLQLLLAHLLKIAGWPDSTAVGHWRSEAVSFQAQAERRFVPSMRQRIRLDRIYASALHQASVAAYDGTAPRPLPGHCPFTLDALLSEAIEVLEAGFTVPRTAGES